MFLSRYIRISHAIVCGLLILILYFVEPMVRTEEYAIGDTMPSSKFKIQPKVPGWNQYIKEHVTSRIVRVPLTPFRAPLITLPTPDKLSDFLIYDPNRLPTVRDQGDCGACWAFAICDILAINALIQTAGGVRSSLSVQYLLGCYKPHGCNGGSPEDAAMWILDNQRSLPLDVKVPYKQSKGGTVMQCPISSGVSIGVRDVFSIVQFIPETGYDEEVLHNNIKRMKQSITVNGPIYAAMTVYDDLFEYDGSRVYEKSEAASIIGGHAISIIGYCDPWVDPREGFTNGYWICRNSWGLNWPTKSYTKGYFTIKMGVNMCGIESRCGFAIAKVSGYIQGGSRLSLRDIQISSINRYLKI